MLILVGWEEVKAKNSHLHIQNPVSQELLKVSNMAFSMNCLLLADVGKTNFIQMWTINKKDQKQVFHKILPMK